MTSAPNTVPAVRIVMTPEEAIEIAIDSADEYGWLDDPTEEFRAALRKALVQLAHHKQLCWDCPSERLKDGYLP